MKTLITFIAAVLTVLTAAAQDYYKDGALFRINDSLTLKCVTFRSTIGILNVKEYMIDQTADNDVATPLNWSAFKKALEETFTPEELGQYADVMMGINITHDGLLKPVDVSFSIENKAPDNTISPTQFAMFRQKLLDYLKFESSFKLNPTHYYNWYGNKIFSIKYLLQSQE